MLDFTSTHHYYFTVQALQDRLETSGPFIVPVVAGPLPAQAEQITGNKQWRKTGCPGSGSTFSCCSCLHWIGLFHRKTHVISFREAIGWSIVWFVLSLAFAVGAYYWMNLDSSIQFLTGYLIEKSLRVGNIFVFALIFPTSMSLPNINIVYFSEASSARSSCGLA